MIHHSTTKKAEKLGFILTEIKGGVQAHHVETNQLCHGPNAKLALALGILGQALRADYPGITVTYDQTERGDRWEMQHRGELVVVFDHCPELSDITDEIAEQGIDLEELEDEEGGSVVKARYKQEYKARSKKGTHCADWLATFLEDRFVALKRRTKEVDGVVTELKPASVFDIDEFAAFLEMNEIKLEGKWADQYHHKSSTGWQGRFRMNGRQILEKKIAERGYVVIRMDGKPHAMTVDQDWLDEMRAKHGFTE